MEVNKIICGDALEVLKTLPDNSINCCISSPPYWALRDYGVEGQLGLESTFEEYLDKLLTIYDEVKRVLRKDGTCFVNLGDTYSNNGVKDALSVGGFTGESIRNPNLKQKQNSMPRNMGDYPAKCLCMIPERFAIGMIERGWILRNKIIWHKPNPMPSSAGDRFTVDFEPVFFFSKAKSYFFEPQYEEHKTPPDGYTPYEEAIGKSWHNHNNDLQEGAGQKSVRCQNPLGRNKRCVWTIPTQACKEAHFATYPEKLVQPMIEAGCPMYVCKKCGKPRKKIYDHKVLERYELSKDDPNYRPDRYDVKYTQGMRYAENLFKGYSDCGCNAGFSNGIVVDPFAGSGTTLHVAAKLKRDYLGIELNPKYIEEIANYRVQEAETSITVTEQKQGQCCLF